MAPTTTKALLLSPAELSYLHSSLSLKPPIRPDARNPTQFRPLLAETDILPGTNGSARICFADGTEAIVGVKAEVEKGSSKGNGLLASSGDVEMGEAYQDARSKKGKGDKSWVEMTIEIPGYRDDDALPVYLAAMLNEALLATGELADKLWINARFHWKLHIDVLLLSPPLSYPVPLLSLTTHLALLSTHLPALVSEAEEDPLFNDDWDAAIPLYDSSNPSQSPPPITLLVASVGPNVFFDPSREELAVADALLAVSLAASSSASLKQASSAISDANGTSFRILAVRTIDPPSRISTPGVADSMNPTTTQSSEHSSDKKQGVWKPPQGGMPRALISRVMQMCVEQGGIAQEVFDGLKGFAGAG